MVAPQTAKDEDYPLFYGLNKDEMADYALAEQIDQGEHVMWMRYKRKQ